MPFETTLLTVSDRIAEDGQTNIWNPSRSRCFMTIRMDIVLAGQRVKQWRWRACVAGNAWGLR